MKLKRRVGSRRGASAVEFAIIAPVLVAVAFGMIESSRGLMAVDAISGAAREVARFAAIREADQSELEDLASEYLAKSNFQTDSVEVLFEQSPSSIDDVDNISCTVTMTFADVSLIGNPFGFTTVRGHASTMSYRESN